MCKWVNISIVAALGILFPFMFVPCVALIVWLFITGD